MTQENIQSEEQASAAATLKLAARPGLVWQRDPPTFVPLDAAAWMPATDVAKLETLGRTVSSELGNWIDRFQRAGIVADRHNSPDLFAQLSQVVRRPVDTVLCSVLDVDPNACLNTALLSRYPVELIAGVALLGRITQAGRAAIVYDARVPSSWFTRLRKTCAGLGIRLVPIINDYPQADPTLMLYTMLGRRLRPGRMPTDAGAILFDAAAAVAIGRYLLLDEPMNESPVVLRDHSSSRSFYYTAPIGMTLADVAARARLSLRGRVVRAADLLRDIQVQPEAVVGGGELIFHISLPSPPLNPSPCIRCGWCVDSCPTRVQPAAILEAAQNDELDLAERSGLEACIECGICSYVCPSGLPLLQGIQKMKLRSAREAYAAGVTPPNDQ